MDRITEKICVLFSVGVLVQVVTGQGLVCDGACVARWKKCAGEGIASGTMRPCCSDVDNCVEKNSGFSQCRPKNRAVPSGWSGAIMTCTDPDECDPTAVAARLSGLSAFRRADNDDIELDSFGVGDLDYKDSTCLEECQANDECFAFDETADGECTLYGKNLFTLEGTLQPFFDAEVFTTKCFLPRPLCDPATREVRRINSVVTAERLFHQMSAEEDLRTFSTSPADYTLTSAINACRLNRDRLGGCIGFAIDGGPLETGIGRRITLLYNRGPGTTNYRGDLAENPEVYSIEACL